MLKHATLIIGLPVFVLAAAGCASTDLETASTQASTQDQSMQILDAKTRNTDFLEQYAATFRFRLGTPSRVKITPEGDQILFLRSGPRSFTQNLYAHDPVTGQEKLLLSAEDLLGGQEEELSVEELARRERSRSAARGIASFGLSKDGSSILVPLSGDLYLVDRATLDIDRIPTSEDELGAPIDPRLSDDGTMIACVRDGDLYVIDVASKQQTRLTTTACDTITNATAEFVAQEEMGRRSGYWWSPDGAFIAYQENDESDVEMLSIMDPKNPGKAPNTWRYPRAGTPNAKVRLGVIPTNGGDTVWIEWDRTRYPYLTTVKWPENAPLTILVQNRHQTEEVLLAIDHTTGETKTLLVESDDAWLRLDQHFPHWLEDGSAFLWSTERNGAWQIERRTRSGDLDRALNSVDAGLLELAHVDEDDGLIYVIASNDPTQRHLGTLNLVGPSEQSIARLTTMPGVHGATFSDESDLIVHTLSPGSARTGRFVRHLNGALLGPPLSELRSVAEQPSFTPSPQWVMTGSTPDLHAVILRPRGYDPCERFPVILHVYGGPSQMVIRSRDRYSLQQWMADQGYIVVSIDGRGTPSRGRDWQRVTKGNLIDIPLEDQIVGLRALGERFGEMDLSRVGVFGWSFGGYFSAHAAIRRGDFFAAGVAGAPVCDWLDYDTHYTERYLGVPPEDQAAYDVSNVLTYADQLEVPLLIIHGTADDNVYLTHSLKLSDALFRAGKDFEFLPLAGFTHMVTEPKITRRMYARIMDFFDENVKSKISQTDMVAQ